MATRKSMTYEEYQAHKKLVELVRDQALDKISAKGFQHFKECPMCRATPRKAGISRNGTFYCFSCGVHDIVEVGGALGISVSSASVAPAPQKSQQRQLAPRSAYLWQIDPMRWHGKLISPLDVVERWQSYKPLSEQSIMEYQLGYGPLPPYARRGDEYRYTAHCNHKRLIYANIENPDKIPAAFRGRQMDCTCHNEKRGDLKWLTILGGAVWLHGAAEIERSKNAHIIIAENPIDRILIRQIMPEVITAAPTAGAGTWLMDWSKLIRRASPKSVMFWYDNDLIGNPNLETRELLIAQWIDKMIQKGKPPTEDMIQHQRTKAMGPKNAAQLQAMGVQAGVFDWPIGTIPKMDSAQYLIEQGAF